MMVLTRASVNQGHFPNLFLWCRIIPLTGAWGFHMAIVEALESVTDTSEHLALFHSSDNQLK